MNRNCDSGSPQDNLTNNLTTHPFGVWFSTEYSERQDVQSHGNSVMRNATLGEIIKSSQTTDVLASTAVDHEDPKSYLGLEQLDASRIRLQHRPYVMGPSIERTMGPDLISNGTSCSRTSPIVSSVSSELSQNRTKTLPWLPKQMNSLN
jgi:hypothetical protein